MLTIEQVHTPNGSRMRAATHTLQSGLALAA
jgi:hypothetical protein